MGCGFDSKGPQRLSLLNPISMPLIAVPVRRIAGNIACVISSTAPINGFKKVLLVLTKSVPTVDAVVKVQNSFLSPIGEMFFVYLLPVIG